MNREPIYAALFDKLAQAPGLMTSGRKLLHWSDVKPINQPALFQAQAGETAIRQTGMPAKWDITVRVYVYASTRDGTLSATLINGLLDYIEAALAPLSPGLGQTLGGLCHDCRIEGQIETDEGTLGDQAVAIVPIRVITAA